MICFERLPNKKQFFYTYFSSLHFAIILILFAGEIQEKGLLVPLTSDIYRPILKRLKKENIEAVETIIH